MKDRDTDALILSEDQDDILSKENDLKLRLDELMDKREIIKKQIKRARRNSGELQARIDLMDESRDLGAFEISKLEQQLELANQEENLLKEGLILEGQKRMNHQNPRIFPDKDADTALQFLIGERVKNEMRPLMGEFNRVANMVSEIRYGKKSKSSKKSQNAVNLPDGTVRGAVGGMTNPDPDDGGSSDNSSSSSEDSEHSSD